MAAYTEECGKIYSHILVGRYQLHCVITQKKKLHSKIRGRIKKYRQNTFNGLIEVTVSKTNGKVNFSHETQQWW